MARRMKVDPRDVGLDIALAFARHFVGTEHLHYGFWDEGLEVGIPNFPLAQERYCDFVISHIPEGTGTILDVGCGGGGFAARLVGMGYRVDGVSPSPFLAARARDILGEGSEIFECRYEDLRTEKRYDLVLFSESFQYIGMLYSLPKTAELLKGGGHMLISDFFKKSEEAPGCQIAGGRLLSGFYEVVQRFPLQKVEDIDITRQTAPNMDILAGVFENVMHPAWKSILYLLGNNHPIVARLLRWRFRKRIRTINERYFSGAINAEHFAKYKSYRLLVYRKTAARGAPEPQMHADARNSPSP